MGGREGKVQLLTWVNDVLFFSFFHKFVNEYGSVQCMAVRNSVSLLRQDIMFFPFFPDNCFTSSKFRGSRIQLANKFSIYEHVVQNPNGKGVGFPPMRPGFDTDHLLRRHNQVNYERKDW